jgi:predicted TIM-barrel fold metal-dependent hydrolase
MDKAQLDTLVMQMDALNMAVMVNLSGGSKDRLQAMVGNMKGHHPHRFVVFANVDFAGIGQPDWTTRTVAQLKADVRNGAQGLKVWKNLGMEVRDTAGRRVPIDDPRLDPIWSTCGELGIPVLIHSADPRSFWEPHDRHNERWLEMKQFPERNHARDSTSWEQLIGEQHNLFRKHPRTIFINAHLGWYGHDLGALGRLMDEMPNMYTELGAVIYELGRQPRFAREWLIRYQDRVLMGKDIWEPSEYHVYFRVLETADEYFDYYRKRHAFWKMYGLDLPDAVLKKLYYQNALRIIPGIDRSAFPE